MAMDVRLSLHDLPAGWNMNATAMTAKSERAKEARIFLSPFLGAVVMALGLRAVRNGDAKGLRRYFVVMTIAAASEHFLVHGSSFC